VPATSNLIAFVASATSTIVVVLSDSFLFVKVCAVVKSAVTAVSIANVSVLAASL
jgi:hypothetical protein